ncbi:MAG: FAD-dependent oxidoreductase [Candidatus Pacebacteria bacterium]|nr:FAD-dependent oxidoreductase [Candidatus Paceibacterota bacterium]
MNREEYDVIIIGAGVSGAAQLYALAQYSDINKVLLVEKESAAGAINSAPTNNSQTLHEGDIETNYTFEKAKSLKAKSHFTRAYLEMKDDPNMYFKGPKMVLGVGETEGEFLRERFEKFKDMYPTLQFLEKDELCTVEPKVCEARREGERLTAVYNGDGITVNYAKLAASLINDALVHTKEYDREDNRKEYSAEFNSAVTSLKKEGSMYTVSLGERKVYARFISVCAGAHSMYFAKLLKVEGVKELSLLSVAGNFYFTPKYITSKIYTVQNPKLPFSAVHGDPDILDTYGEHTRFGPTTRVIFMLERHKIRTIFDFAKVLTPVFKTLASYTRVMLDKEFFFYVFKHNILFPMPFLGNYLFTKEARKIIPSLKVSEVKKAKGQGGVRPQIVYTNKKEPLSLGEAKFEGDNILFNVTPSPGATTCVYNGLIDAKKITLNMGGTFNEDGVVATFGEKPE